jgi:hypothetical protein
MPRHDAFCLEILNARLGYCHATLWQARAAARDILCEPKTKLRVTTATSQPAGPETVPPELYFVRYPLHNTL